MMILTPANLLRQRDDSRPKHTYHQLAALLINGGSDLSDAEWRLAGGACDLVKMPNLSRSGASILISTSD